MTDNTEALPPLPEIVQRADHHFIGEGLAEAVIEYALAQRQQVPERVKYVPVDPRLRNQNWDHPNDDEKCSPECKQALNARGDDEYRQAWKRRRSGWIALRCRGVAMQTTCKESTTWQKRAPPPSGR